MVEMKHGENLVGVDFRYYVVRKHEIGFVTKVLKSRDLHQAFLFCSGVLFALAFRGG